MTGPLADNGKPTLNKLIRVAAFTFISKVGVLDRIEEMGMQDIDVVLVAHEISELITSTHHDPIDQESQKKIREVNFKLPDEKLKEGEICRMQDPDLVENEKDEKYAPGRYPGPDAEELKISCPSRSKGGASV